LLKIAGDPFENLTSFRCASFDACIVGSDQVWNPHYLALSNLGYLLPFKLQNTLKIAYAASAVESISLNQSNVFKKHLISFSSISVRESSTSVELTKIIGRTVHHTLDPTLLLDESDYNKISQKVSFSLPTKYILVYRFGPFINNKVDEIAQKLSIKMGIPVITIGAGLNNKNYSASPSEFIWLLNNATYIITNSYHGTLLSLKFKKKLLVILPRSRAIRLMDILKHLGLEEKILNLKSPFENIDYTSIDNVLSKDKEQSLEFLKTALDII